MASLSVLRGSSKPEPAVQPGAKQKPSRSGRVLYCREEVNLIDTMRRTVLPGALGGGLLLSCGLAVAQSPALPATPPTALQPAATASAAGAAKPAAQPAGQRAQVLYSGGQLTIIADNSSLNQILRDVARQTGMKITGGVADQRVFGKYGPGGPAEILDSLLEGTGSNMLLRESATHAPVELVLTPRGTGVLPPPSPFAPGIDDDPAASDQTTHPAQQTAPPSQQTQAPPQPSVPPQPVVPQTQPVSGFSGAPAVAPAAVVGTAPSTTPSTTGASNPQSPNGVLTPQQIFQQLQQLQQQQQPKSK